MSRARMIRAEQGMVGAMLGLLVIGCGTSEGRETGAAAPAERVVPVRTVEVQAEAVTDVTSLPADLVPTRRGLLAAEVAGRVEELMIDDGDRVRRGEALFSVDRRTLEQGVKEAEAVFRQRLAEFDRAEKLLARQSITQAQWLDAATNRDVAETGLDSARLQLSKSTVTAPWTGRVTSLRVELGDYVQPGQQAVELIDTSVLEVHAPVPAADVPFVVLGAPVTIEIDAFPGELFPATVVRAGAEVDSASRTLDVEAELANPEERLKPGLPARMKLVRRQWEGALLVPETAVVELEGRKIVYLVTAGRAQRRIVSLGPMIGSRIVVEDGLSAGDLVIVEGQLQVSDGQQVTVVAEAAS